VLFLLIRGPLQRSVVLPVAEDAGAGTLVLPQGRRLLVPTDQSAEHGNLHEKSSASRSGMVLSVANQGLQPFMVKWFIKDTTSKPPTVHQANEPDKLGRDRTNDAIALAHNGQL
jgi:hypothetical protein